MNTKKFMSIYMWFFCVILVLLFVILAGLWYIQKIHDATYQGLALRCVGMGALFYIQEHGSPPRSLTDLFDNKYLKHDDGGVMCINEWHAHWKYVSRIQLAFPNRANYLKLDQGRLLEKGFEQERFLVMMVPQTPYLADLYSINKWIWERWVKIERGEPINEDWFKIEIKKGKPSKLTTSGKGDGSL